MPFRAEARKLREGRGGQGRGGEGYVCHVLTTEISKYPSHQANHHVKHMTIVPPVGSLSHLLFPVKFFPILR